MPQVAVPQAPERGIASVLRQTRTALGLTVRQWAGETGFGERTIESWELGETTPRISSLLHIKEVLRRPAYRTRLNLHAPELLPRLAELHLWQ